MIVVAAALIVVVFVAIGVYASRRRERVIDLSGNARTDLAYQRLMHLQSHGGILDLSTPPVDNPPAHGQHDHAAQQQPPHTTHDYHHPPPHVDPGQFHSHPQPDTTFHSPPDSSSSHGHSH